MLEMGIFKRHSRQNGKGADLSYKQIPSLLRFPQCCNSWPIIFNPSNTEEEEIRVFPGPSSTTFTLFNFKTVLEHLAAPSGAFLTSISLYQNSISCRPELLSVPPLPYLESFLSFKLDLMLIRLTSVLFRLCSFVKLDFMQIGALNSQMYALSAPSISYSDTGLFQNFTSSR